MIEDTEAYKDVDAVAGARLRNGMLDRVQDVPSGVDAVKAIGTVSKGDYEAVIEPLVDNARREGRRIRLLYEFGPEFGSFTPAAGLGGLQGGDRRHAPVRRVRRR